MKVIHADIWTSQAPMVCITTNGCVTNDGRLVMGRGVAEQAKDKFPDIDARAGEYILKHYQSADRERNMAIFDYGFFALPLEPNLYHINILGMFQTKEKFWHYSTYALVWRAMLGLNAFLEKAKPPIARVALVYPGIGFGGLKPQQVEPIIERLDKRVEVYRNDEARNQHLQRDKGTRR